VDRPSVLIYRPVDTSAESHRRLAAEGCRVVVTDRVDSRDVLIGAAPDAAALLGATFQHGVMDRAFLESFPNLRIVSKYTIGVDDVDLDAATALGVLVTHSPTEANWGGVAEGTVAFMLALTKRIRERDARVKNGGWRDSSLEGVYVGARADGYPGIVIGLVGLGRIGRRVAELLAPWCARVVATDPYVDQAEFDRRGVERMELESLLRESDIVSLHCSLTAETRGLLDPARLALMKPSAFVVNTARGHLLDLDALSFALADDRLAGAALDVLPEEPPPAGAGILALGDKVLLSPHMVAANQGGTLKAAIPWATEAALAALAGRVPERVYNVEAIPAWQGRFGGRSLL
jgi:phosphoglycerate dehydrogenase-like enzyme